MGSPVSYFFTDLVYVVLYVYLILFNLNFYDFFLSAVRSLYYEKEVRKCRST